MCRKEQGMTILEVVFAITILLIGVGFIFTSNGAVQHYKAVHRLHQQMVFYAAGQLEAYLEKQENLISDNSPFNNFITSVIKTPTDYDLINDNVQYPGGGTYRQQLQLTVSCTAIPNVSPVTINTYLVRVKP
jgi:type II secretory pathway pseudopilin PulG